MTQCRQSYLDHKLVVLSLAGEVQLPIVKFIIIIIFVFAVIFIIILVFVIVIIITSTTEAGLAQPGWLGTAIS